MKRTLALSMVVIAAAMLVFGIIFGITDHRWILGTGSIWGILALIAGIALLIISIVMIVKAAKDKWGGLALATGICGVVGFIVPLVGIAAIILAIIVLVKK